MMEEEEDISGSCKQKQSFKLYCIVSFFYFLHIDSLNLIHDFSGFMYKDMMAV